MRLCVLSWDQWLPVLRPLTIPLGNPRFPEASADVNSKREWMNGRSHNESQNHAFFWAERPRRERLSHRSPDTIVGTLSKFELHRYLLRCERECEGSAYVGPKFGTHVPHLGAGEYLNFLILERLSRKLDASCTLVKLCWSLLRSAEAFSPGDRWGLLIYDAHASHGLARIGIPSAWMNPREKRASISRACKRPTTNFCFFLFLKIRVYKRTMKNWLKLVCFYFL